MRQKLSINYYIEICDNFVERVVGPAFPCNRLVAFPLEKVATLPHKRGYKFTHRLNGNSPRKRAKAIKVTAVYRHF